MTTPGIRASYFNLPGFIPPNIRFIFLEKSFEGIEEDEEDEGLDQLLDEGLELLESENQEFLLEVVLLVLE